MAMSRRYWREDLRIDDKVDLSNMRADVWGSTVSRHLGIYTLGVYSGGLLSGGLQSHTTDFGSGEPLACPRDTLKKQYIEDPAT